MSDIFDDCAAWSNGREFQLVILSLVRLTEVPAERAEKLLRLISEHAMNLLVYVYDGDGSLEDLALKTGLTLSGKRLGQHVRPWRSGKNPSAGSIVQRCGSHCLDLAPSMARSMDSLKYLFVAESRAFTKASRASSLPIRPRASAAR